jgi:hypothetical protein
VDDAAFIESLRSAISYRRGELGSTRMSSRHGGDGELRLKLRSSQSSDTLWR